MNKSISLFCLLFLFLIHSCVKTETQEFPELAQILQEIENLKEELSDLNEKYQNIVTSLTQNQQDLDSLKGQIESLQSQLVQNLNKIIELTDQLDEQGAEIDTILVQLAELKDSCDQINILLQELLNGAKTLPLNGLVLWLPFNGNTNDESVNSNDGINRGSVLTSDRFNRSNNAYLFNGIDQFIEIPDDISLRPDYITISAWFKTNSETIQSLIYKTDLNTAFNEQYSLALNLTSPNQFDCSVKNGGNCNSPGIGWRRNQVTEVVNDDKWHNLIYSYNGSESKIYVDGISVSVQSFPLGVIDNCAGSPLLVGRGWSGDFFEGSIDDIAIWNRPLTESEISSVYSTLGF